MAITFISETQQFTPAFNEVNFLVDSTNKNEVGFRYVVDVYLAGTSTKIYETRIAPRLGDGYGLIPLAKEVQAYITKTLDLNNVTSLDASESFIKFDLKVGEEFISAWSYDDYEFRSGDKTALNSTLVHPHTVGDQIQVKQTDGGALKPMLEGLFTVMEVPNTTEIIIDINFSDVVAGATMGGEVLFADNSTTITRDLATVTKVAFNGVLSFFDFIGYLDTVYKVTGTSTSTKLLTDLPDNFYMSTDSVMFINFCQAENAAVDHVKFMNNNADTFTKSVVSGAAKWIRQFAAGAANMGDGGTVVTSDAIYYDFWLENAANQQLTKKYRVYLDRRCKISDVKILFKDRKGSFLPFDFQLRDSIDEEIKKEVFKQELGNGITYATTDGGEQVTSVNVSEKMQIRTNWLNDEMSVLYSQLLSSRDTFVRVNGSWFKCTIQETNNKVERSKNKRMIRKNLILKFANDVNVN